MLDERPVVVCTEGERAYSPHVVWYGYRYSAAQIVIRAGVGAGDNAPCAAIPMLDKRMDVASAHSPHVVRPGYPYSIENGTAGAGDYTPDAAITMLDKRAKRVIASVRVIAHSPHVVRRSE